jgi:hypothetical protein
MVDPSTRACNWHKCSNISKKKETKKRKTKSLRARLQLEDFFECQ